MQAGSKHTGPSYSVSHKNHYHTSFNKWCCVHSPEWMLWLHFSDSHLSQSQCCRAHLFAVCTLCEMCTWIHFQHTVHPPQWNLLPHCAHTHTIKHILYYCSVRVCQDKGLSLLGSPMSMLINCVIIKYKTSAFKQHSGIRLLSVQSLTDGVSLHIFPCTQK